MVLEGFAVLIIVLLAMPWLIRVLHRLKFGQTEREEGLASHKKKTGTPTMGGLAFIIVPLVVYTLCSLFSPFKMDNNTLIIWISFVGYGLIGFLDDYIIAVKKDNTGLKPAIKFAMQSILAILVFFLYQMHNSTDIIIPGTGLTVNLGWFYFLVVFFMFTGTTNAVNLSDGVDGLCAGLSAIALVPFFIFALWQQMFDMAAICFLIFMALLGYLRYNVHPAKVFMGDTGSLALGGLLAALAMVLKQELTLIVIGGVFVAETLSVIIQVTYYKRTHKRIFLMSPVHHHFEKKGWSEWKVDTVFWAFGALFALIGLWLGGM
ncbi:phospho-N-acetylmuramoyl-pentapeptide-transferase [Ileibacterium valens]|uniref:phospho-N-acetylmuramoyl-pentapeptide- transferase n=1 Tax=Ileibacterium valens TaxID=1862668 RepID=UPI003F73FE0D